ncbi:MAG: SagB/ThcOx family dehydrogenase [Chloroflexi bacterium]|nr:SagB/ThcOx family dehydrogenase [Chloroflexota bacterium]
MESMPTNRDTSAAWRYHDGTKHSWHSVHTSNHRLDFQNQPSPFKIYPQLEGQRLPTDLESSQMPALAALRSPAPGPTREPDLKRLAGLLYYTAGITKRGIVPGGQIFFRAAACTGALYHIELYLVCGDFDGLEAGVYHFGPHDFSLRQLRKGDYRGVLAEASGGDAAVANAPAVLVTSSVYWRNAWKYQARAYRHSYWDSGTMLANLLAMGNAYGLPLKVVAAFLDEPVNNLLGLDVAREAALHLAPVGENPGALPIEAPELPTLDLEVSPYSLREIGYSEIADMHSASSLALSEELEQLSFAALPHIAAKPSGELIPLNPLSGDEVPEETIEPVVVRRGSSRRFRREPITFQQLSTMLEAASQDLPADFLNSPGSRLTQGYLIANNVQGLESGSYVYHPDLQALEVLKRGEFRQEAGYLGLQQELPADASVDLFFLADLNAALENFGNRGYRMAQTEAAIRAGKVYLAAYALRLGASGLTFFDDDVTEFFSPHAAGKSVMFLIALGRPRRRRQTGV